MKHYTAFFGGQDLEEVNSASHGSWSYHPEKYYVISMTRTEGMVQNFKYYFIKRNGETSSRNSHICRCYLLRPQHLS
jgi:hypothetical protein